MGRGSNGFFVTDTPSLDGVHGYGFGSSVGHPRLDSDGLLVNDGIRTYPGHWCCITGPSRQCKPYHEWVKILGRP
jgi:hypothetical protein